MIRARIRRGSAGSEVLLQLGAPGALLGVAHQLGGAEGLDGLLDHRDGLGQAGDDGAVAELQHVAGVLPGDRAEVPGQLAGCRLVGRLDADPHLVVGQDPVADAAQVGVEHHLVAAGVLGPGHVPLGGGVGLGGRGHDDLLLGGRWISGTALGCSGVAPVGLGGRRCPPPGPSSPPRERSDEP